MPSSPEAVLVAAGIASRREKVSWGQRISLDGPGIYVIARQSGTDPTSSRAPVATDRCQELLNTRPELKLDDGRPGAEQLRERIAAFWLPDEVVLYIGLAGTSLASRVGDYYRTPLGARSPHSGGWFLKTLDTMAALEVHLAPCGDPSAAEAAALAAFAAGVSDAARSQLHDREQVMPFANLEFPRGVRKRHGITGAREPRKANRREAARAAPQATHAGTQVTASEAITPHHRTQRVTAADLRAGQVRIPVQSKRLFPAERGRVAIDLRGTESDCRWDPRPGRSGIIGVGRAELAKLVETDEVLRIEASEGRFELS